MVAVNSRALKLLMEHMDKVATKKNTTRTFRAHEPDERVARFTLSYLDAFGHLKAELDQWKDISVADIIDAVKSFQGFFGLRRTGELCVKTVRAMEQPRCGCPDISRPWQEYAGIKNFVRANLAKWQKSALTFAIADYLPGIQKPDFESSMQWAFDSWTRHGNLNARPSSGGVAPDIVISVGRGRQSNFDGPGGTLAWAYLPNGQDSQLLMRFDLDETWVLTPAQRGILLRNVASHEFGHLLGLDHSKVQQALMAPYYNASITEPQANDDIPRFQARYGVKPPSTTPPPPPPTGRRLILDLGAGSTATLDGSKIF